MRKRIKTPHVVIGTNDNYLCIGSVYLAVSKMPTKEQQQKLEKEFGITFITDKQKEELINDAQST